MSDVIFANVGPDGVIVFEPQADPGMRRLTVGSASARDARRFREVVSTLARHAYDGVWLLVPGVPEAKTQDEGIGALIRFRALLEERMRATENKTEGRSDVD